MLALGHTILIWRKGVFNLSSGLIQGTLWGVAVLTNASVLTAFALVLVAGLFQFRGAILRTNGLAALSAILVVPPWLVRNALVLHAPVLPSNFGLELHVSNNELARANADDNVRGGAFKRYHPSVNPAEAGRVRDKAKSSITSKPWQTHSVGSGTTLRVS